MSKLKHRYFISYEVYDNGSCGKGNTEVILAKPIRSLKDIEYVISIIKEKFNYNNVTIVTYEKFEDF